MANSYFQFKQFIIHQELCAMKVSTEACLLGAWVAAAKPSRILDIGTGTGLLALMLAQRIDGQIDAVELDEQAAQQAAQNVAASPWVNRVSVIHQDIFDYAKNNNNRYDLIVSNPPFFTNSLKAETENKNLAKHDSLDFSKASLAEALKILLSADGCAYILYPELESQQFKQAAEQIGLFCQPALIIRNQPSAAIFRVISLVSPQSQSLEPEELLIREGRKHSDKFNELLASYYLKL
ncbi:methyltransferase [Reichenbachiella carrageenanivorans]|uniref:tRNA1(Val) (adenine(37)-N6)-methyltransferase n=1 Tax=Reichenbachiella carrageenanivorans TaxID=2979869 RepID=A0ABY6D0G0_9BACT|nr:methyltransferase [Reichenbachiella carrageenanivorans]UXX79660.1 methyltransferase [Reichenbachiella carrageenanivorans]